MHDVKAIRDDSDAYARGWTARGLADAHRIVAEIVGLDHDLRAAQTALQAAQSRRNDLSKLIGIAKGRKDEAEAQRLMAEVEALKANIAANFERERERGETLKARLAELPNLPADDVPEGADETGNVEVRRWSEPRAFPSPRDHVDLGEGLGLMDFEAAARMSGARFVVLKGGLARLERALGQFMLDLHTGEHGYTETNPPFLVRDEAMFGTGQLPKFRDDLFKTQNFRSITDEEAARKLLSDLSDSVGRKLFSASSLAEGETHEEVEAFAGVAAKSQNARSVIDLAIRALEAGGVFEVRWLIPTAEVSLTNLVREEITAEERLPLRMTALTPCFRAEAGASGRDTRGMIRQHQFSKVELVSITTPEQSGEEHERMTACAETVLRRLGLPYRTMLLCTGDMGFAARKTYDIEVWLPSQGTYREISSCSTCGDFQARRMDARIRKAGEKGTRFPHTLNGSGTAVGRALVAVMENYQDEGGRIAVPDVLQPYMGGLTHVERAS